MTNDELEQALRDEVDGLVKCCKNSETRIVFTPGADTWEILCTQCDWSTKEFGALDEAIEYWVAFHVGNY